MVHPKPSSSSPNRCGNCGAGAGSRFCPDCGQEVATRRGPLWEVGREFLSDWLSLDSKLLRSLRALLSPGRLSELYLSGKRAPFLRPFRLYLVASLVLFSTVLTLETPDVSEYDIYIGGQLISARDPDDAATSKQIQLASKKGTVTKSLQIWDDSSFAGRLMSSLAGERIARLKDVPPEEAVENLFSALRRTLPLTLILFVPLLALGLKLLHIRQRARHHLYLDHLVFSVHFQAALFFGLSIAWLTSRVAGLEVVGNLVTVAVAGVGLLLVYLPWALHRFYGQSRLWTAIKTFVLLQLYSQLLGVIVGISVLVGIWGV